MHAFLAETGKVRLASRAGRPRAVLRAEAAMYSTSDEQADGRGAGWRALCAAAIGAGYTPVLQCTSTEPLSLRLLALRHRASGRYAPYELLLRATGAFDSLPIVPRLATWRPSERLRSLARQEPRRALDETAAELRQLLAHTAPARGGALHGCWLFLPSGLTLGVTSAVASSKLRVQARRPPLSPPPFTHAPCTPPQSPHSPLGGSPHFLASPQTQHINLRPHLRKTVAHTSAWTIAALTADNEQARDDEDELLDAPEHSTDDRATQLVGAAQLLITCAFDTAARAPSPDDRPVLVGPWQAADARASIADALRKCLDAAERRYPFGRDGGKRGSFGGGGRGGGGGGDEDGGRLSPAEVVEAALALVLEVAERHGPRGPPDAAFPVGAIRAWLTEGQQLQLGSPSKKGHLSGGDLVGSGFGARQPKGDAAAREAAASPERRKSSASPERQRSMGRMAVAVDDDDDDDYGGGGGGGGGGRDRSRSRRSPERSRSWRGSSHFALNTAESGGGGGGLRRQESLLGMPGRSPVGGGGGGGGGGMMDGAVSSFLGGLGGGMMGGGGGRSAFETPLLSSLFAGLVPGGGGNEQQRGAADRRQSKRGDARSRHLERRASRRYSGL